MKRMKTKKSISRKLRKKSLKRKSSHLQTICLAVCAMVVVIAAYVGIYTIGHKEDAQVYAASESENKVSKASSSKRTTPSGLAGVISGMNAVPEEGTTVNRIGTSCEEVIVGQRVHKVESVMDSIDMKDSLENVVSGLENISASVVETPKMMTDYDYDTLLSLVEAEATGEDLKGKILIANVIMNRVASDLFPNTVTEVIWDDTGGMAQFSPTYDGRISAVVVSDETKEAVRQALNGVDYSQGALYFMAEAHSESESVDWFKNDLQFLFNHGNHSFYKYPDPEAKAAGDGELVQLTTSEETTKSQ